MPKAALAMTMSFGCSGNKFFGLSLAQAEVGGREESLVLVGSHLEVARQRYLVVAVDAVYDGIVGAQTAEHLAVKLHLV